MHPYAQHTHTSRFAAALLALALALGLAGGLASVTSAYAADPIATNVTEPRPGNALVIVSGTYQTVDQAAIKSVLDRINEIRKEAYEAGQSSTNPHKAAYSTVAPEYKPLQWSSEMEYVARIRAMEAAQLWSHERPSGGHVFPTDGYVGLVTPHGHTADSENLAYSSNPNMLLSQLDQYYEEKPLFELCYPYAVNECREHLQSDYQATFDDLTQKYGGYGHYEAMISYYERHYDGGWYSDARYQYVGSAAFANDNGKVVPVFSAMEFSAGEQGAALSGDKEEPLGGYYGHQQALLEVKQSYLQIEVSGSNNLKVGEDAPSTFQLYTNYNPSQTQKNLVTAYDPKPVWSSSNKQVATVDRDGKVHANSAGKTTITAKLGTKSASYEVTVTGLGLTGIAVDGVKTQYFVGDTFDYTKGTITATYSDGSTKKFKLNDAGVTVTGFDSAQAVNDQTITVTLGGKSTTYRVNIVADTIQSVTAPDSQTVVSGTAPAYPATVKTTWKSGKTTDEPVTWNKLTKADYGVFTGGNFTVNGTLTNHPEQSVSFTVTVKPATAQSVTQPGLIETKVNVDPTDKLPATVKVTYSNGDEKDVAVSWPQISASQYATAGNSFSVTGTAAGLSVTQQIKVLDRAVTSVKLSKVPAKRAYFVGDALDLADGEITVNYDTGDPVMIALPHAAVTASVNMSMPGEQTVTLTYSGQQVTYTVTVQADAITGVTAPSAVTVASGTAPAYPDTVKTTWKSGKTTDESVTWTKLTKAQYGMFAGGKFTVNGKLTNHPEQSVSFTVTVQQATAQSVKPLPVITTKATVDPTSKLPATVQVTYSNGDVVQTAVTWDPVDASAYAVAGSFNVTGKAAGLKVTQPVTVQARAVSAIALDPAPAKSEYLQGDKLDLAGGKLKVTYDAGASAHIDLANAGVKVSGYDPNKAGDQTITVSYADKTATFRVHVQAASVVSISVNGTKNEYVTGDAFDKTHGTITASYDNGNKVSVPLTAAGVQITGFDSSQPTADQTVTIEYAGKSTTINVQIKPKPVTPTAASNVRAGAEDPATCFIAPWMKVSLQEGVTYTVTVNGVTRGFDTGSTDTVTYGYGETIKVVATAKAGYTIPEGAETEWTWTAPTREELKCVASADLPAQEAVAALGDLITGTAAAPAPQPQDYTSESWAAYAKALASAKKTLAAAKFGTATAEDVQQAVADLTAARKALTPKSVKPLTPPTGDNTKHELSKTGTQVGMLGITALVLLALGTAGAAGVVHARRRG